MRSSDYISGSLFCFFVLFCFSHQEHGQIVEQSLREVLQSLSLEILKSQLDKALSNLLKLALFCVGIGTDDLWRSFPN